MSESSSPNSPKIASKLRESEESLLTRDYKNFWWFIIGSLFLGWIKFNWNFTLWFWIVAWFGDFQLTALLKIIDQQAKSSLSNAAISIFLSPDEILKESFFSFSYSRKKKKKKIIIHGKL